MATEEQAQGLLAEAMANNERAFAQLENPDLGKTLDIFNRGYVGGLVGTPADLGNELMHAMSFGAVPKVEKPVGGSEWLGDKMQEAGMVSENRYPGEELLASLLDPSPGLPAGFIPKAKDRLPDVIKRLSEKDRAIEIPANKNKPLLEDLYSAAEKIEVSPDKAKNLQYLKRSIEKGLTEKGYGVSVQFSPEGDIIGAASTIPNSPKDSLRVDTMGGLGGGTGVLDSAEKVSAQMGYGGDLTLTPLREVVDWYSSRGFYEKPKSNFFELFRPGRK